MTMPAEEISAALHASAVVMHEDAGALAAAVAQRIAALAARSIRERGRFCIALAGGETPRRSYELLRGMDVDWKRVHICFGDERCLPRGDAGRNDSMAQETLLDFIAMPADNVHAIPAEHGARIAATEYAAMLEHLLPLDLVLLGMGEDGHTASLFPGDPATRQQAAVVPVYHAPKLPPERVSLGMGVLNSAREKIFLVSGKSKQAALGQIMRGIPLPAAQVKQAEWHIDRAAMPVGYPATN